jgi:threonine dehydrogenase-like Zn-dependent dehydrogenase
LIEPLAVGFHAANQGGAHAGQKAIVFGAGCIGLVSIMALKAEGISQVYVADIMDKRLGKALELGAAGVINRVYDAVPMPLYFRTSKKIRPWHIEQRHGIAQREPICADGNQRLGAFRCGSF